MILQRTLPGASSHFGSAVPNYGTVKLSYFCIPQSTLSLVQGSAVAASNLVHISNVIITKIFAAFYHTLDVGRKVSSCSILI